MDFQQNTPSWRTATRSRVKKWFPERQVHLRTEGRVTFFRITTFAQILAVILFFGTSGWVGFTSYSYVEHDKIVAGKNNLIANARLAYESLLGEVAEYQNKFTTITSDLEQNHALMLGLVERNASLQQNLRSISRELEDTQDDRHDISTAREALLGKLAQIEVEMRALSGHNFALKDNLNSVEDDLQTALSERNQALFEGTRLRRHVTDLETRLGQLQETHENSAQRLTEQTIGQIQMMEQVINVAGLDPKKLKVPQTKKTLGQGGPFIPATSNDLLPAGKLKDSLINLASHLDRLNALKRVMERLPLTAPLDNWSITSRFGKRRDPINKRWSAHYGVDFGGVIRQSIYVTAPGTVRAAGWKAKYGRFIEIDHGSGVRTRYGHLHKIFVKRGQKVNFRHKIGLLGNSGRSTGAHLHYETVFNGKAIDPMKFLKAGRYVFQEQ